MLDHVSRHLETGDAFERNGKRLLATKPPRWADTYIECVRDATRERAAARDLALSVEMSDQRIKESARSHQRDLHAITLGQLLCLAAVNRSAPAGSQRLRHAAGRMRQVAALLHEKNVLAQMLWWCGDVEPVSPGRPVTSFDVREVGQ